MSLNAIMQRLASTACKKDHNEKELQLEENKLREILDRIDKEENVKLDIVSNVMEIHDRIEALETEQHELEEIIQDIKKHLQKYAPRLVGKSFKHYEVVGRTNCWVTVEFTNKETVVLHYDFQSISS